MRNSKIMLCNGILIDRDYKNVINYSDANMLTLANSKKIAESNTYSFIRETGTILVDFPYNTCLQANYMAYQNPDYSNKWFYAWIDKVSYKNDKTTEISFTIDVWSTWYNSTTKKKCFVVREHVSDDTIGANTIPENIETGEYIVQVDSTHDYGTYYMCSAISEDILKNNPTAHNKYNGVVSGLTYIVLKTEADVNNFIFRYNNASKIEAINSLFMIPEDFVGQTITWETDSTGTINFQYISKATGEFDMDDFYLLKPSRIGEGDVGYLPKNNKLFTFPYCYIYADNNAGSGVTYNYEDFKAPEGAPVNTCSFKVSGTISPGCCIKYTPENYKNTSFNYSESLNGAKLPLGGWINDTFTNWLTQNGVNIAISGVSSLVQLAGGVTNLATGNAVTGAFQVANAGVSIASTIGSVYQHSLMPDQAMGNTNSSDISFALGYSGATFYQMSIKIEYAKIIDEYFTKFGYKVNRLKLPNTSSRSQWNYIQIGDGESWAYGNIPAEYLSKINEIAIKGVTIWHNHNNIGNYDLTNSIV